MLANSVKNQTRQIFQNIEILLDTVPENEFDTIKGGFKKHGGVTYTDRYAKLHLTFL
jgi:hypothetical protein